MANATKYYDSPTVLCGLDTTTSVKVDGTPAKIVQDFQEAVECLFCCCCSGSGSGGGSGSGSGSGTPCCETYGYDLNPANINLDVWLGYNYTNTFVMCLQDGGTVTTQLTMTNQDSVPLRVSFGNLYLGYQEPCSATAESFVYNNLEVDLPVGTPVLAGEGIGSNLQPCCSYFVIFIITIINPLSRSFMAMPAYEDLVDTGDEATKGSEGIAGPGCTCFCENPPAVTKLSGTAKPVLPVVEEGFVLDHAFMDLGGEPNCKYLWNLHVDWLGQGEGVIFARDRCSVIPVDRRSRDVAEGDSLPAVSFDYQLLTCGPATLGMQMRNSVVKGVPHPGQVNMSAELVECLWGYNRVCCCGPYPPCPEVVTDPIIHCVAQSDGLPAGWLVDEAAGVILAGAAPEAKLAGLSYIVEGDPTCAYKVRIELDVAVSPSCLATFVGGDYVAFAVGADGKGSLYTDLWVCGGASFALLLSGCDGRAKFKVTYAGERRAQTPICCT